VGARHWRGLLGARRTRLHSGGCRACPSGRSRSSGALSSPYRSSPCSSFSSFVTSEAREPDTRRISRAAKPRDGGSWWTSESRPGSVRRYGARSRRPAPGWFSSGEQLGHDLTVGHQSHGPPLAVGELSLGVDAEQVIG